MTGKQLYESINDSIKIGCAWCYLSAEMQNKWSALAINIENQIIEEYDMDENTN